MSLMLKTTSRTFAPLLNNMSNHYSKPKGFVGRNICYAIYYDDVHYGSIVGGSATANLAGRDNFFDSRVGCSWWHRESIINNIFFHVEPVNSKYPIRNFTTEILRVFRKTIIKDWSCKYGDQPVGFETLIELPRTGETYRRDGWQVVGQTKGFTCKRVGGVSTDSWSGKRVWNTTDLRPKLVMCRLVSSA